MESLNMKKIIITLLALLAFWGVQAQETYRFAHRDTCNLYLDIYWPDGGADPTFQGRDKPTILNVFGGGFLVGSRNDEYILRWVELLNREGYTVVTMDYRLGMKDYRVDKGFKGLFQASDRFFLSQQVGVEDVFSAVSYLAENDLVDTDNLVIAGNSAGAIIALASAYEIANGHTQGLPEGFQFKGVMSFSGAIISTSGAPKFQNAPCPILLFHGDKDKAVAFHHLGLFGRGMWGSSYLAQRLQEKGYPYSFYRIQDRNHAVATYQMVLWGWEKEFLEQSVMLGKRQTVDAVLQNPDFPVGNSYDANDIYSGNLTEY